MKKTRLRVVKGMPSVELSRKEFVLRFHQRHEDTTFGAIAKPLDAVAEVAWKNYIEYHKSPQCRAQPGRDRAADQEREAGAAGRGTEGTTRKMTGRGIE